MFEGAQLTLKMGPDDPSGHETGLCMIWVDSLCRGRVVPALIRRPTDVLARVGCEILCVGDGADVLSVPLLGAH